MARIRVLVIDDLPLARKVLADTLAADAELEVVSTAGDAWAARRRLDRHEVDVVTLDLELPGMDGLSLLRSLLAARAVPVVMVSAFTPLGSAVAVRALELGAVDVVVKPDRSLADAGPEFARELVEKVKAAARSRVQRRPLALQPLPALPRPPLEAALEQEPVLLLGASTGGCAALPFILAALPSNSPPAICVQHLPAAFTESFAKRMDTMTRVRVSEARSGDVLERGRAYVAPGGKQLVLLKGRGRVVLDVHDGPPVNRHKPSIDVTFLSAARVLGARACAALLTGMGRDGVEGLFEIRAAGGFTLAQDEESSVVFGMPREAILRKAAQVVAPLEKVAALLLESSFRRRSA